MADRLEIVDALESLAVHCRPPLMSVEDRSRWMRDWCEDLKSSDAVAIRLACQRWRQGEDRKFPMPGQLIPLIRAVTRREEPTRESLPIEWEIVSDEVYREFSVREKIRYLTILESTELLKAGPMFRQFEQGMKGTHLTREEMPLKWHTAHAEARRIREEIKRLREIIAEPMPAKTELLPDYQA